MPSTFHTIKVARMDIAPVQRRRLYQEVADRLESLIRRGELPEGGSLPSERELMERFAVGRPAIREALLSLQQKGLIAIGNGERARVIAPDAERLIGALSSAAGVYLAQEAGARQFQAARRLFEGATARQAARIATASDVRRIGEALRKNRQARGDLKAFRESDIEFHLQIVRTGANPLLTGVHRALTGWLAEQRNVSLRARGAEATAFAFHQRIFAAIAGHDPDAAEAEMHAHLDAVTELYWQQANREGPRPRHHLEAEITATGLGVAPPRGASS